MISYKPRFNLSDFGLVFASLGVYFYVSFGLSMQYIHQIQISVSVADLMNSASNTSYVLLPAFYILGWQHIKHHQLVNSVIRHGSRKKIIVDELLFSVIFTTLFTILFLVEVMSIATLFSEYWINFNQVNSQYFMIVHDQSMISFWHYVSIFSCHLWLRLWMTILMMEVGFWLHRYGMLSLLAIFGLDYMSSYINSIFSLNITSLNIYIDHIDRLSITITLGLCGGLIFLLNQVIHKKEFYHDAT